jgi:hypothetical protein
MEPNNINLDDIINSYGRNYVNRLINDMNNDDIMQLIGIVNKNFKKPLIINNKKCGKNAQGINVITENDVTKRLKHIGIKKKDIPQEYDDKCNLLNIVVNEHKDIPDLKRRLNYIKQLKLDIKEKYMDLNEEKNEHLEYLNKKINKLQTDLKEEDEDFSDSEEKNQSGGANEKLDEAERNLQELKKIVQDTKNMIEFRKYKSPSQEDIISESDEEEKKVPEQPSVQTPVQPSVQPYVKPQVQTQVQPAVPPSVQPITIIRQTPKPEFKGIDLREQPTEYIEDKTPFKGISLDEQKRPEPSIEEEKFRFDDIEEQKDEIKFDETPELDFDEKDTEIDFEPELTRTKEEQIDLEERVDCEYDEVKEKFIELFSKYDKLLQNIKRKLNKEENKIESILS